MWLPFSRQRPQGSIEDALPEEMKNYLQEHQPRITDREFERTVISPSNISTFAPAPSLSDITKSSLEASMSSYNQQGKQPVTPLSSEQLKQMAELNEYRRRNPLKDAVLENCSEIQKQYFDCISLNNFLTGHSSCEEQQKFHESCVNKQIMIFQMFDYESMVKVREMDEIRGIADVIFNRHFKQNSDLSDELKLENFKLELNARREKFYQKYGK